MKKTAIIVLILMMIISFSCKKEYKFYSFYITKSIEFSIPIDATSNFEDIQTVNLKIDKKFETENTKESLVEEITIEEVTIDGGSYSYFRDNDFKVFISSENTSKELLASNEGIAYSSGTAKLKVSENSMKEHVKASTISIITNGTLNNSPESSVKAIYNIRFRVKTYVK